MLPLLLATLMADVRDPVTTRTNLADVRIFDRRPEGLPGDYIAIKLTNRTKGTIPICAAAGSHQEMVRVPRLRRGRPAAGPASVGDRIRQRGGLDRDQGQAGGDRRRVLRPADGLRIPAGSLSDRPFRDSVQVRAALWPPGGIASGVRRRLIHKPADAVRFVEGGDKPIASFYAARP
jgi:hypothetical protein